MRNMSFAKIVFLASAVSAAAFCQGALAQSLTDGGVNFADSLGYTKPRFLPISVPDEASATNKYYVNLSSGSGSTCSQSAPCGSLNSVSGKAGTSGGTAYIYVKGNGYLNLTSGTLAGATGKEVVIKPWPGDSTPTVWTAQGGCSRPAANTISASGVHNVIIDGGPDMLIRFKGSGCTNDQNGYTLVVASDDITLYRVRIDAAGSAGPALGPAVGSGTHQVNFKFINSEIYGASRYYGVYAGGGTGCAAGDTSFQNMEFRNNVFRDIDGRGIQLEPRANSDGAIIDGNAFHNIGYNRSGSQNISSAVQPASSCGGMTDHVTISNNIGFDLGGGFARVDYGLSAAANFKIIDNTVYDYANASPVELGSHAITASSDGYKAEVRNNILLAPANGGVFAINRGSGFVTSDNLCESGMSCGASAVTSTASNALMSVDANSTSFLFPKGAALGAAVVQSGFEIEYLGKARTAAGTATDVGAVSSGGMLRSMPPTNVKAN
jgi:hypothetical protein